MNIYNILHSIKANVDYTKALETVFREYYFNDSVKRYNFIIQFAIKSDNFYFNEELFNDLYKLHNTFKSINMHKAMQLYKKNNEAIRVYLKANGTKEEKERFLYRERGINRIFGKEEYKKYSDLLKIDLIKYPNLAQQKNISCRIAMEFWKENDCDNKINDIEELTKTIQGECNETYIEKIKELMKALKIY